MRFLLYQPLRFKMLPRSRYDFSIARYLFVMTSCDRTRLAAASEYRNDFPRVAESIRIKRPAHAQHNVHVIVRKDQRQKVALIESDTVFTRDRAASAYTRFHEFPPSLFH